MSIMEKEILSCRDLIKNSYNYNLEKVKRISNIIKAKKIDHIEIVARGSSRNACELFKYILENNSQIRVSFVYPSTVTKYKGTLNKNTCYLAVSQGGKGEDIRLIIEKANKEKALTIALTNEENTPLNKIAKYNLYMKVEKELSMAATKTFTAENLILGMLAYELSNKNTNNFKNVNSAIDSLKISQIKKAATKISKLKNLFVLTRGLLLGNGKEICCKLQETCFINANCFAVSDFMHGPFALVDKSFYSIILLPNDQTKEDVLDMVKKIKKNNGHIILIGDDKNSDIQFRTQNKLDYIFAMTYAIQLLSSYTAAILGRNPDKSRNLNKYTKTI